MVVKTDRVGEIADTALDGERLAQGIVSGDGDLSFGLLGEAQHHEDGGGFAGAVGAEQPEHLAFFYREVQSVDGNRLAVALGDAFERDDRFRHRRPNLLTAPNITSSAAAMTPRPATPQRVEVSTVMRYFAVSELPSPLTVKFAM